MTLLRPRLLDTPHSGIRRMLELAREVPDPLLLVSGDPNFRTPEHIIAGAAEAALGGATGYAPAVGIAPLRAAIAKKLAQVNRIEADADQICVVTGGCGGLYTTLLLLVGPGDDVLIPNPGWSNYAAIVHVLGGRAVGYPVGPSTGRKLDPEAVEAAVSAQTRAIILNSPGNPAGVVWTPESLQAVVALAGRRGIPVVSDEAYDELVLEGEPFSVGSVAPSPELISVFTFSKTYAMTGWRIGYVHWDADFAR
jgi:aspartate aminotransferase